MAESVGLLLSLGLSFRQFNTVVCFVIPLCWASRLCLHFAHPARLSSSEGSMSEWRFIVSTHLRLPTKFVMVDPISSDQNQKALKLLPGGGLTFVRKLLQTRQGL